MGYLPVNLYLVDRKNIDYKLAYIPIESQVINGIDVFDREPG